MTYMAREPYANFWPKVADTAFVAESADLIGDVTIGEHASVWYHTTLRADINKIVIGDYSNIQDNSCIHLADDFGCYVGKYVTVGHGVILHACTVEDNCLQWRLRQSRLKNHKNLGRHRQRLQPNRQTISTARSILQIFQGFHSQEPGSHRTLRQRSLLFMRRSKMNS